MILFIHGFGSCGWGEKSLTLRRHFGIAELLAPDLPFHPQHAIDHLRDITDRYRIRALIGSSLGGFYATHLNATAPLPTVLINPAVWPQALRAEFAGPQRRWCDGAQYFVDDDYLAALDRLQRDRLSEAEAYLVLLQQGDEVLDYRVAESFYAGYDVITSPGGSHRFDDLTSRLPAITQWLQSKGAIPLPVTAD